MHNTREKRIHDAAKEFLTTDQKRAVAEEIGVSMATVYAVLSRRKLDKYNIADACLPYLHGDFSEIKKQIKIAKHLKNRINALDFKSLEAGIKYFQGLQ